MRNPTRPCIRARHYRTGAVRNPALNEAAKQPPSFPAPDLSIEEGVLSAIGYTPLVRLRRAVAHLDLAVYAKLEGLNPGGSAKDRAAIQILRQAIQAGRVRPDTLIIESSSGNMGIGLAQACVCYGLRLHCVVDPRTNSHVLQVLQALWGRNRFGGSARSGHRRVSTHSPPPRSRVAGDGAEQFLAQSVRQSQQRLGTPPDDARDRERPGTSRLSVLCHQHLRHAPRLCRLRARARVGHQDYCGGRGRQCYLRWILRPTPAARTWGQHPSCPLSARPRPPLRACHRSRLCARLLAAGA